MAAGRWSRGWSRRGRVTPREVREVVARIDVGRRQVPIYRVRSRIPIVAIVFGLVGVEKACAVGKVVGEIFLLGMVV
jgi:hypothetical protein